MIAGNGVAPRLTSAGIEALPTDLRHAVRDAVRTPHLLVGCDYDGTIAPIVEDPSTARPLPHAIAALRAIATLPTTTATVISGRSLRDLAAMSRLPAEVHLIGSHGSEFDVGVVDSLGAHEQELLKEVLRSVHAIADDVPGVLIETKPAALAVHVRRCDRITAARILDALRQGPAKLIGVHVTEGSEVIELSVVDTDKGRALDTLRHRTGSTAAIFIGDDRTDEKVFVRLTGPDVGVKVGEGESLATHRVDGPEAVANLLALIAEERGLWLTGGHAPPIERISMTGDGRTVALIGPDASLVWMCYPDPDSPAVFASLLGDSSAGHFSIHPLHGGGVQSQSYVDSTLTVRTTWAGLTLLDYLDRSLHPHDRDGARPTRLVRVLSGRTPARVVFAPRPQFGHVSARLQVVPDGVIVVGASDPLTLRAEGVTWEVHNEGRHQTAVATVDPSAGDVVLELRCGSADIGPHHAAEPSRRTRTHDDWRGWLGALTLPKRNTAEVARSALTLRALCHEPTGSILAAATTSLPEQIGGLRNWDYRYCWIRDASMTAYALLLLGSDSEADAFLRWMSRVMSELPSPEHLHPLYTLYGNTLGPEAVIDTLPGYAGSRPVRVGNAAQGQVQIDVFGPVVELIEALSAQRGGVTDEHWMLVEALIHGVEHRWDQPDHGIWEIRDRPRHHVHSKVMCWLAVDRALRMADMRNEHRPRWIQLRHRIEQEVLSKGYDANVASFVSSYGRVDIDAASLHVGLSGLLAGDDPRFVGTVNAVEDQLRNGAAVYRYRFDDALPGVEGGMYICATWLAEAYLLSGRRDDAELLFRDILATTGPTGLLPEQYDPETGRGLGNHPQAYSHLGVIRVAHALENS